MKLGAYLVPVALSLGLMAPSAGAQNAPAGSGLTAGGSRRPVPARTRHLRWYRRPSKSSSAPSARTSDAGSSGSGSMARSASSTWATDTPRSTVGGHCRGSHDPIRPRGGGGLGARLLYLTIGPRFHFAKFKDLGLWTLGGEVGLRIPSDGSSRMPC